MKLVVTLSQDRKRGDLMNIFRQVIRHPAGKVGLTVGLGMGVVAALMGKASQALFFVSLCRFIASRIGRHQK